jgi:Plasmid pRiA4b ORF-3-like protein
LTGTNYCSLVVHNMSLLISNYIFRVKFLHQKKVYRDIEIYGDWSLYDLAELILKSVKFEFDHCCGFYGNFNNIYDSEEVYELFVDANNEDNMGLENSPNAKALKTTLVQDVFKPKKKMLFLFDYGDNWEFEIACLKITDKESTRSGIIQVEGKAPKQYPATSKGWTEWELFH